MLEGVGDKAVNAEVQATFVMKKNLRMRRSKIRTERKRDRDWHKGSVLFQRQ